MFQKRTSSTPAPDYSSKGDAAAVASGEKKTFNEAHYRPASQDGKKRCHECKSYLKPGQPESDCAKVISVVKAEGYCDLWSQRDYKEGSDSTEGKKTLDITVKVSGG
jgi:hypothetical protein